MTEKRERERERERERDGAILFQRLAWDGIRGRLPGVINRGREKLSLTKAVEDNLHEM